ncbi:PIG-L family deacetylase [Vibrio chagasii]|nr:PIG-L family deacetylase [Vibrio chagasii]
MPSPFTKNWAGKPLHVFHTVSVASLQSYGNKGMTLEDVKRIRHEEATAAAAALGVSDIRFFDFGDYPLEMRQRGKYQIVDLIREIQPRIHHDLASKWDPYNTDHMYATEITLRCRMIAQAWGHNQVRKC